MSDQNPSDTRTSSYDYAQGRADWDAYQKGLRRHKRLLRRILRWLDRFCAHGDAGMAEAPKLRNSLRRELVQW